MNLLCPKLLTSGGGLAGRSTTWSNTCLPRAGMEMLQGWKEWAFSANVKDIDLVENYCRGKSNRVEVLGG